LLFLLNSSHFAFIEQKGDGKDECFIHTPQSLADLSVTIQKLQIKFGFDVVSVSGVPTFTEIISVDYIPETSYNSLSADFLTNPDRGPPRLITTL
jgi:hypothetical protein